jgi:hypothetical protein
MLHRSSKNRERRDVLVSLRETNRRREVNRKRARSLREDVMLKMLDSTASQASAEPVRIRND